MPETGNWKHSGSFSLTEIAELHGVHASSIARLIKRHGLKSRKSGKHRLITIKTAGQIDDILKLKVAPRADKPPLGWFNSSKALAYLGSTSDRSLQTATKNGFLHPVRVICGRNPRFFYNPDELKVFKFRERDKPLAGYVALSDFVPKCADKNSVKRWLIRQGYPVRRFYSAAIHQNALYALEAHLEAWRKQYVPPKDWVSAPDFIANYPVHLNPSTFLGHLDRGNLAHGVFNNITYAPQSSIDAVLCNYKPKARRAGAASRETNSL